MLYGYDETDCRSGGSAGGAWAGGGDPGEWGGNITHPVTLTHTFPQYGTYIIRAWAVDMTDPGDVIEESLTFAITSAGPCFFISINASFY